MYLHLGQDIVVKKDNIIGIFDLDTTTISKISRNYINGAEKRGEVINVSYELPKSFIVCSKKQSKDKKVYISQISTQTLLKRSEGVIENGIEINL